MTKTLGFIWFHHVSSSQTTDLVSSPESVGPSLVQHGFNMSTHPRQQKIVTRPETSAASRITLDMAKEAEKPEP
jgi:hypothetical protein